MNEGLAYLFILFTTLVACAIAAGARNRGPRGQRALAALCVVLGFVSLVTEAMSWAAAAGASGEYYIVWGGEIAFWVAAGYLYKMAGSAKSISKDLVAAGRTDREAALVYSRCLREMGDADKKLLSLAYQAFAEHGPHEDLVKAADRLLEKDPKNSEAMASLVGAYVEEGRLHDAERVASRFAKANPDSEEAGLALEKVRALRAEVAANAPIRTLVDVARETSPSDWSPIKVKRYAAQIAKVLEQATASESPQAISPEEIAVDDAKVLTYRADPTAKMRAGFMPPEGPLQAGEGHGPGLVYAAGQLLYFLLSRGQTVRDGEKPVALGKLIQGLSGDMEKAIIQACDSRPNRRAKDLAALQRKVQAA